MTALDWTVVVPTMRRHDALVECLNRLAPGAQSIDASRYEVVVSDDARSDETRAFLADRFPWVRWEAGPARGPAANRNHGAARAHGAWLAFTDDDTLPSRDWLAAFDRAAGTSRAREELTARAVDVSPALVARDALEGRTTCAAGFGTPMHYAPVNERGGLFWSCNIAVRADRFRALGGFDEGFAVPHMEDQDLRERLRRTGVEIAWVPGAVVDHPPRRQPSGRRLGLLRASEVRYLYKHGAPRPIRWRLVRRIVSLRLGIIRSLPWSVDSLRALASLMSEIWTVQLHLKAWERVSALEFSVPAPSMVAQRAAAAPPSAPWGEP